MKSILKRVCKSNGADYGEFLSEIRRAQRLCNMDDMSEAEFIKTLTLMALREYIEDERTTTY